MNFVCEIYSFWIILIIKIFWNISITESLHNRTGYKLLTNLIIILQLLPFIFVLSSILLIFLSPQKLLGLKCLFLFLFTIIYASKIPQLIVTENIFQSSFSLVVLINIICWFWNKFFISYNSKSIYVTFLLWKWLYPFILV